jgi:hypothetical protein
MNFIWRVVGVVSVATSASIACGHGIPIIVNVDGGTLTVSNGVADPLGYAPMIFVDDSVDAMMDHLYVPALGDDFARIDLPGLNIQNMAPGSGLYLEVLPRPVKNSNPATKRLLWHWSQQNQSVALDPLGESLVIASDFGNITVPQTDAPQPQPLEIAAPAATEIGVHKHYLDYLLHDNPAADAGAYGFFARLSSPTYAASAPFLVILNDDIDPSLFPGQLMMAALAIDNAALLAGDFNHDDTVNAADFALWKSTFGSTSQLAADGSRNAVVDAADYTIWRDHLGQQFTGGGAAAEATVPEPATLHPLLLGTLAALFLRIGVPKLTLQV